MKIKSGGRDSGFFFWAKPGFLLDIRAQKKISAFAGLISAISGFFPHSPAVWKLHAHCSKRRGHPFLNKQKTRQRLKIAAGFLSYTANYFATLPAFIWPKSLFPLPNTTQLCGTKSKNRRTMNQLPKNVMTIVASCHR